jgi:membrane fusion protein, copper/silver efflux system
VKAGDMLLQISDRSSMWLIVQVFEQQLGQVKVGEKVRVTVTATPGKEYDDSKVDFIYPHLDPSTRTAKVRVVIPNPSHDLHENMFAQAVIEAQPREKPVVLVPREAVMDSGVRQIVFLDEGNGHFQAKEVAVGHSGVLNDAAAGGSNATYTEILSGVTEKDKVVTSGQFLLDSESRLEEARKKFASPTGRSGGAADPMPGMNMGGAK